MASVPDLHAVPERSVLVANLGAPEVNRLSIELERRERVVDAFVVDPQDRVEILE